jgi:hypothetical protein
LVDRVTLKYGSDIDLWSARDALELRALIIVLPNILPLSRRCTHFKRELGTLQFLTRIRRRSIFSRLRRLPQSLRPVHVIPAPARRR